MVTFCSLIKVFVNDVVLELARIKVSPLLDITSNKLFLHQKYRNEALRCLQGNTIMDLIQRAVTKALAPLILYSRNLPPIRKPFLYATLGLLPVLAILGFTPLALPINDKVLHFIAFALITITFFFSFDAGDWSWNARATAIICGCFGAVGSEFVQGLLPYKQFDSFDIIANIAGHILALSGSILVEIWLSRRSERAMYKSLSEDLEMNFELDDDEVDDEEAATLPTPNLSNIKAESLYPRDAANVHDPPKHVAFALEDEESD